jgi:hypothetical protein
VRHKNHLGILSCTFYYSFIVNVPIRFKTPISGTNFTICVEADYGDHFGEINETNNKKCKIIYLNDSYVSPSKLEVLGIDTKYEILRDEILSINTQIDYGGDINLIIMSSDNEFVTVTKDNILVNSTNLSLGNHKITVTYTDNGKNDVIKTFTINIKERNIEDIVLENILSDEIAKVGMTEVITLTVFNNLNGTNLTNIPINISGQGINVTPHIIPMLRERTYVQVPIIFKFVKDGQIMVNVCLDYEDLNMSNNCGEIYYFVSK